ncbi:hypothetical protein ACIBCM_01645 [Streptomyces sp. NPDC051018]|uniref:hypothetical protein n=1 Tax=Streptomyces sp. NPDC051018 TaxID=3365639 RepID=UPI0037A02951
MRGRLLITGMVLGATALLGTAATAQAAVVPAGTSAPAGERSASAWIPIPGTFPSSTACNAAGASSVYSQWDCVRLPNGRWQLWVNDAS